MVRYCKGLTADAADPEDEGIMVKKDQKLCWNSLKKHPKSLKMMPRNVPGAILEKGWFQDGSRSRLGAAWGMIFGTFGCHLAIFIAIWAPAGRQWGPKIHHFGIKMHKKWKNASRKGCQKKIDFLIDFYVKKVRFWVC